jgi:hypothetical protein
MSSNQFEAAFALVGCSPPRPLIGFSREAQIDCTNAACAVLSRLIRLSTSERLQHAWMVRRACMAPEHRPMSYFIRAIEEIHATEPTPLPAHGHEDEILKIAEEAELKEENWQKLAVVGVSKAWLKHGTAQSLVAVRAPFALEYVLRLPTAAPSPTRHFARVKNPHTCASALADVGICALAALSQTGDEMFIVSSLSDVDCTENAPAPPSNMRGHQKIKAVRCCKCAACMKADCKTCGNCVDTEEVRRIGREKAGLPGANVLGDDEEGAR